MEQYRLVATPEGPITYRLVKKRVRERWSSPSPCGARRSGRTPL